MFTSYGRKTETISTILHSPQTILEKSNSNTAVTKVSSHVRIFKYLWIIQLVFESSQSDFTRVALHPLPLIQSWDFLANWKIHWLVSTLHGGAGVIFYLYSHKSVQSLFSRIVCEIVNFSSEFTFLAITQSLQMGIAPKFTHVFISTYSTRPNKTNAIISNI